ncbi:hypothetical protein VBD025_15485 [Virgibacillus flavescens]|uniref:hypothetical protein n=1 Tax=Virgibacillus flavescens TaxID=1611422 RepID=UPI003D34CBA4
MRILWLVFSLIPAPFFFHFYEYGQHLKREEAPFLIIGSILFVVVAGFLSSYEKIRYVILINIITGLLSIFLGKYFLPDDYWFAPFGRDGLIIIVAVVMLAGQLVTREASRAILIKEE